MDEIKKLLNEKQFNRALFKLSSLTDSPEKIYLKAVCFRYLGEYRKAIGALEDYELNFPENARVYQERGYCYEQLKQIPRAVFNFQKAIHLNDALISSILSIIKYEKHLSSDEYQYYQYLIQYLKSLPPELLSSLSFLNQGMYLKAEKLCKSFLQKHKLNIDGMVVLSKIARAMKVYDQAEFLLETALETNKKHHEANYEYIRILQARQKYSLALIRSGEMVSIFPESKKHLRLHAISLTGFEQFDEAIKIYDKILQKDPNSYDVYHNLGHLYKTLGSFDSSANNYRKALAINPFFGDAYWSLANLKNANFSKKEINRMEDALSQPLADKDIIEISFALGKAYEDKRNFKKSFQHYKHGNQIRAKHSSYTKGTIKKELQNATSTFPLSLRSSAADVPIFIVGLPRAGSTLVEQILASHSQIEGTRELPTILSIARKLSSSEKSYPGTLTEFSQDKLTELGKTYIEQTKQYRYTSALYFTDKMPNNFRHIGLIKSILPKAKVIDVRKPYMAACFSCYKQLFAEGQEFTYSLDLIHEYYTTYIKMMEFWDSIYPNEVFLLDYELLVNEPKTQINNLLDYLELPKDESCYKFYETNRAVHTPSSSQVRQPIYNSLNDWKNYEDNLTELENLRRLAQ